METRALLSSIVLALATVSSAQAQMTRLGPDGVGPSGQFGHAVSRAGDVNNDGFDDVIVGAVVETLGAFSSNGTARVYSGFDGSLLYTKSGGSNNESFGHDVAGVGDINQDGFDDFAVGAPYADNNGFNSGSVHVFSGKSGVLLFSVHGNTAASLILFGWSVDGVGDTNNDGTVDFVVGCPFDSAVAANAGSSRLYLGPGGAPGASKFGAQLQANFGSAVAGVGDANGDGTSDYVVGAPKEDVAPNVDAGAARLFNGGGAGALLFTWNGPTASGEFGTSVAGAGDANGDGRPDVIVGSPLASPGGISNAGIAQLRSGATGALLRTFSGDSPSELLGMSVGGAGDTNQDGRADQLTGGHGDDGLGPGQPGTAKLWSGATGGMLAMMQGDDGGDRFGWSCGGVGDTNNDGFPDWIVGATAPFNNETGFARIQTLVPGLTTFGRGTPGCSGRQFTSANTVPRINTPGFRFECGDGPPATLSLLLAGNAVDIFGSDPFVIGVLIHVDLFLSTDLHALDLVMGPKGYGAAAAPIPNNPMLVGVVYYAQTLSLWPAACVLPPFNLSSSTGLRTVIQP